MPPGHTIYLLSSVNKYAATNTIQHIQYGTYPRAPLPRRAHHDRIPNLQRAARRPALDAVTPAPSARRASSVPPMPLTSPRAPRAKVDSSTTRATRVHPPTHHRQAGREQAHHPHHGQTADCPPVPADTCSTYIAQHTHARTGRPRSRPSQIAITQRSAPPRTRRTDRRRQLTQTPQPSKKTSNKLQGNSNSNSNFTLSRRVKAGPDLAGAVLPHARSPPLI